jgi:hypothetical protein
MNDKISTERLLTIFSRDGYASGCECDSCELIRAAEELLVLRGVPITEIERREPYGEEA